MADGKIKQSVKNAENIIIATNTIFYRKVYLATEKLFSYVKIATTNIINIWVKIICIQRINNRWSFISRNG